MLDDLAIPDRLGAKLAGARVELHARQVGLFFGLQALDDERSRVEEQPQWRALPVGGVAGRAHRRDSREEIKLGCSNLRSRRSLESESEPATDTAMHF